MAGYTAQSFVDRQGRVGRAGDVRFRGLGSRGLGLGGLGLWDEGSKGLRAWIFFGMATFQDAGLWSLGRGGLRLKVCFRVADDLLGTEMRV